MSEDNLEKTGEIRRRLEKHLEGKAFYFNPDPDIVESIIKAIAKRRDRYGEDYCPCRVVTGDKEKDAAIICPCVYHEREIDESGRCHCHLFTAL